MVKYLLPEVYWQLSFLRSVISRPVFSKIRETFWIGSDVNLLLWYTISQPIVQSILYSIYLLYVSKKQTPDALHLESMVTDHGPRTTGDSL